MTKSRFIGESASRPRLKGGSGATLRPLLPHFARAPQSCCMRIQANRSETVRFGDEPFEPH